MGFKKMVDFGLTKLHNISSTIVNPKFTECRDVLTHTQTQQQQKTVSLEGDELNLVIAVFLWF